jgi:hypothetical protein
MNRFNRYPTPKEIIARNKRVKIISFVLVIFAIIIFSVTLSMLFNAAMIALGIT